MAKKNNKVIEIKTKKLNEIGYNQDYIVIDGHYIIHKDYALLDDTLMQDKINKNESFYYQAVTKSFNPNIPDLKQLIPVFDSEFTALEDINLYTIKEGVQVKLFYNREKNYITYMNHDYFKMIDDCTSILNDFRQTKKFGTICIFDSDCKLIYLVMPISVRDTFFTENYVFNRAVESVLPDMDNLHKYQIA